jgi:hypothetical protein
METKVFFTQVWDNSKNYARYANEFMSLLPDDSYACITDGDVMFLNSDYGNIIYEYTQKYPLSTLTARTNRIACPYQKLAGVNVNNHDIVYHKRLAQIQTTKLYTITDVSKEIYPMSGMLMVIKKSVWEEVGGFKGDGLLGIDNNFFTALQQHNKQILVMEGLYIYHQYRIDGSKKHLV